MNFPGLLGLVSAYLDTIEIDPEALARIERYLNLVRRRANGQCSCRSALAFQLTSNRCNRLPGNYRYMDP